MSSGHRPSTHASPEPDSVSIEFPFVSHRHHWRIDEQAAAQSLGNCPCGASRSFFNGWNDERDGWHGGHGASLRSPK